MWEFYALPLFSASSLCLLFLFLISFLLFVMSFGRQDLLFLESDKAHSWNQLFFGISTPSIRSLAGSFSKLKELIRIRLAAYDYDP